jgi:hypothetical protein
MVVAVHQLWRMTDKFAKTRVLCSQLCIDLGLREAAQR